MIKEKTWGMMIMTMSAIRKKERKFIDQKKSKWKVKIKIIECLKIECIRIIVLNWNNQQFDRV